MKRLVRRSARGAATQALLLCSCAALLPACGEPAERGSGDLALSVAANRAVRNGFPHEEDGTQLAFVDGWSVALQTFAVSITRLELVEATPEGDGEPLASWEQGAALDVVGAGGEAEVTTLEDVPEGRHEVRFTLAAPGALSASNLPEEDLALMRERGYSIIIRGVATPHEGHAEFDEPVTFDFGFALEATYFDCINGADGTQGVVVADNRLGEAYIYPHIVHLFWDTLGAGDEQLRFDAMARAAGEDNLVSLEDLDEVDLTSPKLADASGVPLYNDAGLLDTYTLGAFTRRAMLESMHFNGIGFCKKRLAR